MKIDNELYNRFLALGVQDLERCDWGIRVLYQGEVVNTIEPYYKNSTLALTEKEYKLYQEFCSQENSPL